MRGWVTPLTSWKVGVVLLGIIFLKAKLKKPQLLRDEMMMLQIKQNIHSIGIYELL